MLPAEPSYPGTKPDDQVNAGSTSRPGVARSPEADVCVGVDCRCAGFCSPLRLRQHRHAGSDGQPLWRLLRRRRWRRDGSARAAKTDQLRRYCHRRGAACCSAMRPARRAGISRRAWPSRAKASPPRPARAVRGNRARLRRKPRCVPLGVHAYLRDKDLALFGWIAAALPDPSAACTSRFALTEGTKLPEFDRFGLFTRGRGGDAGREEPGALLAEISLAALCEASN